MHFPRMIDFSVAINGAVRIQVHGLSETIMFINYLHVFALNPATLFLEPRQVIYAWERGRTTKETYGFPDVLVYPLCVLTFSQYTKSLSIWCPSLLFKRQFGLIASFEHVNSLFC